jgi:GH35 family endo-1,4-beta-xylanase
MLSDLPMRRIIQPVFAMALAISVTPGAAQPRGALLEGGENAFRYEGPAEGPLRGAAALVPAAGQPFARAWRLETLALPERRNSSHEGLLRLAARLSAPLAQGDSVGARFWIRCVRPEFEGECSTRFVLQAAGGGRSVSKPLAIAPGGWREVRAALSAPAAGEFEARFTMGQQVQVFEVGGVALENHGPGAAVPGVPDLYEGAGENDPWRIAARERIERIRKAPLAVQVRDAAGKPVSGATVHVKMKRHAFGWGTAVAASTLLGRRPGSTPQDMERYRRAILENFNMAVLENDLKWPQWEASRQPASDALGWLRANGIHRLRGHTLVWPSWRWLPPDLKSLAGDPEALRRRALGHVEDIVTANAGSLVAWDVVNEPFSNYDLLDILGDAEMAVWFKKARQHDPGVELFINDFGILSNEGADLAHQAHYLRTIRALDRLGAGVQAIGLQGHFSSPTPPARLLAVLDRFAGLGRPLAITEYDFETSDEALQARFTRDLLTVCFSHPAVREFLMWGFWEGSHWKPRGAMVRRDWSERPMYQAWRDLVFREWWTDVKAATGPGGSIDTRGFLGEYDITACRGAECVTTAAWLGQGGNAVRVTLR